MNPVETDGLECVLQLWTPAVADWIWTGNLQLEFGVRAGGRGQTFLMSLRITVSDGASLLWYLAGVLDHSHPGGVEADV